MSSTGVLPFLRGADLSYNDFHQDNFPKCVNGMKGLKWLRLNRTQLDLIPEEFGNLDKLEKLNISHNNLTSLYGELTCLPNLRYLNCSNNKLKDKCIPVELFNLKHLMVIDISHNQLKDAPQDIENCKSLLVLNLSHNDIQTMRDQVFVHLTGLLYLDLSNNRLNILPPQLGRLTNLRNLILRNNPLGEYQMRQIKRLKSLRVLDISNTQRTVQNMPIDLRSVTTLVEVNLSSNRLHRVPDDILDLKALQRLNLSENLIAKIPDELGETLTNLETLNLSGNKLKSLPQSICKLCNLRRLYLNDNQLDFAGLPSGIGKLRHLEVFMAARNNLELIPEGVFRCGRLKKLILTGNRLITLPDTIHLLYDLEVLELSNNPDLVMPPKPMSESAKNAEFYNIDFSLNTQLRLAGDPVSMQLPSQTTATARDPIARKLRLRRRAKDDVDQETNQAKVLRGMTDLAKEKDSLAMNQTDFLEADLKPKRWDESLEKPPIDYSEFFDDAIGQLQGLTVWEIDNFCPVLMDSDLHGKFYEADCYIILSTQVDDNHSLHWKIFYWIGLEATLDKKACSAIHAVNLRNFLNAQCRTIREEQGEETDEFLELFPDGIDYVKGARKSSGFWTVEETKYTHRMFRLHEVQEKSRQLHLETVSLSSDSLDSRFVFLIDCGYKIYVWNGLKSKNTIKQKARLLAEKLNNEERKNKATIIFCDQGEESSDMLDELQLTDTLPKVPFKTPDLTDDFDVDTYQPRKPILYQVCLGMGYIELPQIEFKFGRLLPNSLVPSNVYILDCFTDVFVWLGRKSSRLVRNAALKLAQEAFSMIKRPRFACITSCLQGTESQLLKTKFKDWDDVIAVDYTRTAESVSKTGANLTKWMVDQKIKIDLVPLFTSRQPAITDEESQMLSEEWNEELEMMEGIILDGSKRFVKLQESEFGHFYSEDCYVFLCKYYVLMDETGSSSDDSGSEDQRLPNGVPINNGSDIKDNYNNEAEFRWVVYFWQGRDASNMGWLTFTFGFQKKLETRFGKNLEVIRMHQQQENIKFLSHFKQKFIIHKGRRGQYQQKQVEFYHLRSNSNPLTFRCIEIEPDAANLNSGFCYILKLACSNSNNNLANGSLTNGNGLHSESDLSYNEKGSTVYVWIGSKSDGLDARLSQELATEKFTTSGVYIIQEGQEPEEFFSAGLNGKKEYDTESTFMQFTRLFRCSNDKGYFSISEKCADFCQDDLSDEDIMILDNGTQVFLWVGSKSSEVEIKLAYKSAQVYVQNLRIKQADRPRQLMLTFKGKETRKFTKCFHGWSQHRTIIDPRGDERKFLLINAQSNSDM